MTIFGKGTVLLPAVVLLAGLAAGCGGLSGTPVAGSAPASGPAATAPSPPTCTFRPEQEPAARPAPVPPNGPPQTTGTVPVAIESSAGPLPLTLDRAAGPCAVVNFLSLAGAGYFDNTPCHRLTTRGIKVLQCGDPTGQGTGGPGYTLNDEPPTSLPPGPGSGTVIYPRGTVAMAKTAAPDSGGSQFFLVYGDSPLMPDYTVFGTVDEPGLATLDAIAAGGNDGSNGSGDGRPTLPVTLTTVKAG